VYARTREAPADFETTFHLHYERVARIGRRDAPSAVVVDEIHFNESRGKVSDAGLVDRFKGSSRYMLELSAERF
jgi:hypothetical protein